VNSKLDMATAASAVGIAAYLAIAVGYVAHYVLDFSAEEIRDPAVAIALTIAALVAIDFFGKMLRKAK
jgi:hypothetical protein